jgi:hypothetical protein
MDEDEIDAQKLKLLTLAEYQALPNGVFLQCIDGSIVVKGRDTISEDTRSGFIAYGLYQLEDLEVDVS